MDDDATRYSPMVKSSDGEVPMEISPTGESLIHEKLPNNLLGVVDMGSNGIRFSITDLSPPSARALPTVYQDRLGLSLYDAQYSTGQKGPIPQQTISEVVASLQRFRCVCADFKVSPKAVTIVATEATRNAENAEDFVRQVEAATKWQINMIPKEEEGRIGAMGVASSFASVEGLVMDLGGGSTQITWMISEKGHVKTSPKGSFSFPYGAAAMTRRLAEIRNSYKEGELYELSKKIRQDFEQAYRDLEIPDRLQELANQRGLTLYLSGGGFRGWGYLLMSQHRISPYPIPIINGFQVSTREFRNTLRVQEVAASGEIFRVSKRRAEQVPAVAFVVNALVEALPVIENIRFCQGGVREGYLFSTVGKATRSQHPLKAATARFGGPSSEDIAKLLIESLPGSNTLGRSIPSTFGRPLVRALADLMFIHSSYSKESTSVAALYTPITGPLASAHGISHNDRALLALMLCQRWDGELAPPHDAFQARLRGLLTVQEVFWCNYLGTIAKFIGDVYPAGDIIQHRLRFASKWTGGLGKKGLEQGVALTIKVCDDDPITAPSFLKGSIETIEAVGKKKNRIGGRDGFGVPIEISVERDLA